MASKIGELQVALTADAGQFKATLDQSSKEVRHFTRGVESSNFSLKRFSGLVGALASTGGLVTFLKHSADTALELDAMSRRTGETAENLQILKEAAKHAGTDLEALESGLYRVRVRAAEAGRGINPAAQALRELGVEAQEFQNLRPEAQLRTLGKAFEGVRDQATRAHLANQLFGKSGQSMLRIFVQGQAGLDRAKASLAERGNFISNEDVAQIAAAKRELNELGDVAEGLGMKTIAALAPAVHRVTEEMIALAQQGKAGIDGIGYWDSLAMGADMAAEKIFEVVGATSDFIQFGNAVGAIARSPLKLLTGGFDEAAISIETAVDAIQELRKAEDTLAGFDPFGHLTEGGDDLKKYVESMTGLKGPKLTGEEMTEMDADAARLVEETRTAQEKYNDSLAEYNKLLEHGFIAEDIHARAVKEAGNAFFEASGGAERLKGAAEALAETQRRAADITENLRTPQESYGESVKELTTLLADGHITQETYNRGVREASGELMDATGATERLQEAQDEVKGIVEATRSPMENYTAELGRLNELHRQGALDAETFRRAQADAKAEYEQDSGIADAREEGKKVFEETRTPLEAAGNEIAKLDKLLAGGHINQDTYRRGVQKIMDELDDEKVAKMNEELKEMNGQFGSGFAGLQGLGQLGTLGGKAVEKGKVSASGEPIGQTPAGAQGTTPAGRQAAGGGGNNIFAPQLEVTNELLRQIAYRGVGAVAV